MNNHQSRVLVLLFGDIEFDGRVQRIIDIASKLGQVTLLDVSDKTLSQSSSSGVYRHERLKGSSSLSVVRRHLNFWAKSYWLARCLRPDYVFAEDFFVTLPGFLASRAARAKFIYDAHELIVLEKGAKHGLRRRFWAALERAVIHSADLVIAANPERAQIMSEYYGLSRPPTYMRNIPSFKEPASSDLAEAETSIPILKRRSVQWVVLYQGSMTASRGIGRFIEAMKQLDERYALLLVGDGPDLPRFREEIAQSGLGGRVLAIGRVQNTKLAAITKLCDLGIVTYPYVGLNNVYCAPNKVYEYAQAGIPVLATDQPPLVNAIKSFHLGEVIAQVDGPVDIADKISALLQKKSEFADSLQSFVAKNTVNVEKERVENELERILL